MDEKFMNSNQALLNRVSVLLHKPIQKTEI